MLQSPRSTRQTTTPPPHGAFLLIMTALDTTWRAFVPTIGGTVLGIVLDNLTDEAPLYTTAFISVGFVISVGLIVLQIKKVRRS